MAIDNNNSCRGDDWITRTFNWIDYTVFALTLLVSLGIGIFYAFGGKQKTTAQFLMGNKKMNAISLGISLSLGFTSAIAILGNPAEMYYFGTQYVTMIIGFFITIPFTVYLFLPVMRELGITSMYEYLERRFNNKVRIAVVLIYLLMMLLYITVIVYAPALALRQVTGIDAMVIVAIIFAVAILYSSLGGIKAVVWSDVFQSCVIITAICIILYRGFLFDTGISNVWTNAENTSRIEFFNFDLNPTVRHTFWSTAFGISVYWIGLNCCTQTYVQRLLSVATQRDALIAVCMSSFGMILIYIPTFYIGLQMYTYFKNCDPLLSKSISAPDQIFPLYVMEVAGELPGIPGLFVAAVFSASLSTVGSALNAVSASILRDILDGIFGYKPKEKYAALLTRFLCAFFGIICFLLTFFIAKLGGLLQVAISFNGMVVGVLIAVFTLGMYFPWSNSKGVLTGIVIGLSIMLWLGLGTQIEVINGNIRPIRKSLGTDCNCEIILPNNSTNNNEVFIGYKLSYLWYSPIGFIFTFIVGLLSSFLFDRNNNYLNVDPMLLSPNIRNWFIQKCHSIKNTENNGNIADLKL